MGKRLTFNEVNKLASQIEGADVVTYTNGNITIRLNAINLHGDDELLEELTMYNKLVVNMDEAKQLVQEKRNFQVHNSELMAVNAYGSYGIYSHDILIKLYDMNEGEWRDVTEPEAFPAYAELSKARQRTLKKHMEMVNEWVSESVEK